MSLLQLFELYGGAEISTALISKITDEVETQRKRGLEAIYRIVFFDCLVVKVRQDKQIKMFLVSGSVKMRGINYGLANLTELKNRGIQDILIACTDNLTGMSEAISAAYPELEPSYGLFCDKV